MYRPAARSVLRAAQSSLAPARTNVGRRFLSTDAPHLRSRSWKNAGLRWGIAIAGLYYYNTSPVFAEEPQHNLLNPNLDALDGPDDASSLDALTSRGSRKANKNAQILHSAADAVSSENASTSISAEPLIPIDTASPEAAQLEDEAEAEGAFNPETGEINWDCPCLGGMAHGPCGPQFRDAFSCFVFSKEEPKGMDCIEKFQGMRDCFQEHPDVYKDELMEDEEIDREIEAEREDMAQQIAERQKANVQGERRLLEETASTAPAKTTKPKKQRSSSPSEQSQPSSSATGEQQKPNPSKSSKPAQASAGTREVDTAEGILAPKSTVANTKESRSPIPPSTSTSGGGVIPEAAYDATDATPSKAD